MRRVLAVLSTTIALAGSCSASLADWKDLIGKTVRAQMPQDQAGGKYVYLFYFSESGRIFMSETSHTTVGMVVDLKHPRDFEDPFGFKWRPKVMSQEDTLAIELRELGHDGLFQHYNFRFGQTCSVHLRYDYGAAPDTDIDVTSTKCSIIDGRHTR